MIYYHTTDAADAILRDGFRDATGGYLFATTVLTGVWLGDSPMTVNEGAKGETVLRVEFPDDVDLGDFEVIEDCKPYREWCVPAELINERASVTLMAADDELPTACDTLVTPGPLVFRSEQLPDWLKRRSGELSAKRARRDSNP